jgi:hypothetical protein
MKCLIVKSLVLTIAAALGAIVAFAQNPVTADSPYQVRYTANLNKGDSLVNLVNTNASNGSICVNAYAVSPNTGDLVACCSCSVGSNHLASFNVKTVLLGNTVPASGSVVVKLIASTSCNPASIPELSFGLAAWGTTVHPLPKTSAGTLVAFSTVTETAFTPSTLSAAELASLTSQCGALPSHSSCSSCQAGGQ